MHGCCGLVRAPTELERTQDMHTATLPKRVLLARTTPPPSLDLRPPSDKPMTAPRGRWTNRCSQPYAHEESAREVTRPLRARGPKTIDDDIQPISFTHLASNIGTRKEVDGSDGARCFSSSLLVNVRLRRLCLHPAWLSIMFSRVTYRPSLAAHQGSTRYESSPRPRLIPLCVRESVCGSFAPSQATCFFRVARRRGGER